MLVLSGGGVALYLVQGCEYTVGRSKDCDLFVRTGPEHAVSRMHGKVKCEREGGALYTDTSQFGSLVNQTKVKGANVYLEPGCKLQFGTFPAIYSLENVKISASNLTGREKSGVVGTARKMSIEYSNTWDESCTTLIMERIVTTPKVIEAVSDLRTILLPKFLYHLEEHVRKEEKMPPWKQYRPTVGDKNISHVNFSPNLNRQSLCDDLTFVFFKTNELTQHEKLVRRMGGKTLLLDPLNPSRRNILLSESSVIVETADVALNDWASKTLAERNLVPVKYVDVALALFYVDRERLFKKINAAPQPVEVQDTQATQPVDETQPLLADSIPVPDPIARLPFPVSQFKSQANGSETLLDVTPCVTQGEQRVTQVEPCVTQVKPRMSPPDSKPSASSTHDTSVFEPSAVPQRLDKTLKTPTNTSVFEPSAIPQNQRLDKSLKASPNTSVFEPSAIPQRLDKTLKTPANTSVFEPSAVSQRLDKSLKASPNTSVFEPSAIPQRLDKTLKTPAHTSVFEPSATPHTLDRTPGVQTPGSDVSLFSRNCSLFDESPRTTPRLFVKKKKRALLDDSDEEECNPFEAAGKFKFTETYSTLLTDNSTEQSNKKQKTESSAVSPIEQKSLDPTALSNDQKSINSVAVSNDQKSMDSVAVSNDQKSLDSVSDERNGPSIKRELVEKSEPVNKKVKLEDLKMEQESSVVKIPDASRSSGWIINKRPAKPDLDRPFAALSVTANITVKECATPHPSSTSSVPNFKRFKKSSVVSKSIQIKLKPGEFRSSSSMIMDSLQSNHKQESDDECESQNVFRDRRKPVSSGRTKSFFD